MPGSDPAERAGGRRWRGRAACFVTRRDSVTAALTGPGPRQLDRVSLAGTGRASDSEARGSQKEKPLRPIKAAFGAMASFFSFYNGTARTSEPNSNTMLVKIGTMNLCRLVQVTKPCKLLCTDRTVNCLSRKLHISALGHGGLIARSLGIRKLHNSPVIRHGESSSNIEYKARKSTFFYCYGRV
jgi:hypothetical protein